MTSKKTNQKLVLDKAQERDIKKNLAQVLRCANCGDEVYYGTMGLISLGILQHKPSCSYECNKALGQTT